MGTNADEGAGDIEKLAVAMTKAIGKLDEAIYDPTNIKPEQIDASKFILENAQSIANGFKYVEELKQSQKSGWR